MESVNILHSLRHQSHVPLAESWRAIASDSEPAQGGLVHLRAPLSNPRFLSFRGTPGSFPREIPHTNSPFLISKGRDHTPSPELVSGFS